MSARRFTLGQQFYWRDGLYEVKRLLPNGQVRLECLFTGEVEIADAQTLVAALFAGEMQFVTEGRGAEPEKGQRSPLDLGDYPEHLVAIARYRLEVIRPLLTLSPSRSSDSASGPSGPVAPGRRGNARLSAALRSFAGFAPMSTAAVICAP